MQYILVCGPNIEWITFAAQSKLPALLESTSWEWRMASVEWRVASGFTRHSPLVTRHSSLEKGEVSEWSIEHAWKACVLKGTAGSNPALSAKFRQQKRAKFRKGPQKLRLRAFLAFSQKRRKASKKRIKSPHFFANPARVWRP